MKICMITDELVRCRNYIEVVEIALDHPELFPNAGAVVMVLADAIVILEQCIKELDSLSDSEKDHDETE